MSVVTHACVPTRAHRALGVQDIGRLQQELAAARRALDQHEQQAEANLAALREQLAGVEGPALRVRLSELEALLQHARADAQNNERQASMAQQRAADLHRAAADSATALHAAEAECEEVRTAPSAGERGWAP
jgi:chromosome segregation ATPase